MTDAPPTTDVPAAPDDAPIMVAVDDVGVRLGSTVLVEQVSFAVPAGQWLGLIGPNGAGKSTLLRAIVGLIRHSGTIRVGDPDTPRARTVAYVPQSPVLPAGMTVAEYVLLGRTVHIGWLGRESSDDRAAALAALERLELGRFADRELSALSGGEVQRVSLARALASGCPVLILDEPTSALDIGHQMVVLELVEDLRRTDGLTVISAMHDLTTAGRFTDRLVLLHAGRVAAIGRADEVLTPHGLSTYYQTPVTVLTADDGTAVVVPLRSRGASHD